MLLYQLRELIEVIKRSVTPRAESIVILFRGKQSANLAAYRNLLNSVVIPEHKTITITPSGDSQDKNTNLMIVVDGTVKKYHHVHKIKTTVDSRRITYLKLPNHHFYQKVRNKFIEKNS